MPRMNRCMNSTLKMTRYAAPRMCEGGSMKSAMIAGYCVVMMLKKR